MQQPLAFSFNAYRVGRFPWREDVDEADIAPLSTHDTVDTVYLSPFSGPSQVVTLPNTFSASAWSAALVLQDPAWGAEACPVWPTVSAGAMIAVPRPPVRDLVCVHVTSHLEHFALCIPRVTSIAWLVSALRTARVLDVLSLRIPPALGQSSGDSQDEIAWRTGDLIVALPPDAFTGLFQTPVFTRAEQLRHCAIWSLDFCLAAKSDAVIWQPDTRPLLTTIPRGSRWCALDATFEGAFSDRYPGCWAPAPWIAEDRPHLIRIADSDRFVHVVVETPTACFCTAVHAHSDSLQLRADLPTFQGYPRVLSIPDDELRQGTTLRDGDVVIEVVGSGHRVSSIRLGVLGPIVMVTHLRWRGFGGLGILYSLQLAALLCAAGPPDAPSPDSSEARTVRSRIGRGRRSHSRSPCGSQPGFRFFPQDARRSIPPSVVPLHMWHPSPSAEDSCFGTFGGMQGELVVRTMCPVTGQSGPCRVPVEAGWPQLVESCQSHCGRWTDSFISVRGSGHKGSLTVLPACPPPFSSVVIQGRGILRAVLVPQLVTLPQLCFIAQHREGGHDAVVVTTTPGVYSSDRRRPLLLRNGDCIGLSSDADGREGGLSAWSQYRDPQDALSAASWALPFVLELGGSARFWFAARRDPSHVILRSGTWWDPVRCSFRDAQEEPMQGTWIPALSGCLPDLHLISPGAPLAAHVFCIDTRDNQYPLLTAHLGGPDATSPPFGWRWHPSITATFPTRLRDGDVLVVDPTADRVWDPLAGVPPTVALDQIAVGVALVLGHRFALGLSVLLSLSGAFASPLNEVSSTGYAASSTSISGKHSCTGPADLRWPAPTTGVPPALICPSLGHAADLQHSLRSQAATPLRTHLVVSHFLLLGLVGVLRVRVLDGLCLGMLLGIRPSWGVRLDSASFAHRLWQPGDGLQDPIWSHETRCPQELLTRFPAWNIPVRVCPAVYGGGWEWIPGSVDPSYASIVLVAPPMPRAALLPRACAAHFLLSSLRLQLPSLTQVEVTPAAWRGTRKMSVPTLYLRDGDVVQVRAQGWMPMLRAPPVILHCSPHSAARDAFWGLPFRTRDPA